ncbi:MAG TPA: hypothetical protein V6D18_01880 [Thermosynechococcaceae cyanobacterium]
MLFPLPLLAQEGSQAAARVITDSLSLSNSIVKSWDQIWKLTLDATDGFSFWSSIVRFALGLAVLALIYYFIQNANEIMRTQSFSKVIEMAMAPLVVLFLLGGDGYMLSRIVLLLRGVGRSLIAQVLTLQLAGLPINKSISQINSNLYAMQRIRQVFQECETLTGKSLTDCLNSKQAEAQGIIDQLSQSGPLQAAQGFLSTVLAASGPGQVAQGTRDFSSFMQGNFTQIIQDRLIPVIQTLLWAIQWGFVNCLEAALLLTALFSPIAVALMLFPVAGNALSAWFCGFIAILAMQLGYNLLVGLIAVVLTFTDQQTGQAGALGSASNFGFLLFISIFSPFLAVAVGRGGGAALYEGISRKAAALAGAAVQVVAQGVKFAVGVR